jgi:hypothetical protein
MPNPILANSVVLIRAYCTQAGQTSVNSFYYLCTANGAAPGLDSDAAVNAEASLAPVFKAIMTNNATFRGVTAQIVQPPPLPTAAPSTALAGVGTAGNTALPAQTCGIIHWPTPLAGRRGRGRTYLPFPDNADNPNASPPVPSAAYVGRANAVAAAVIGLISFGLGARSSTVQLALYRRPRPHAVPPVSYAVTPMLAGSAEAKWATQRRRGDFGRLNSSPI